MNQASGIGEIGQISVQVREVERAKAFYRDVLGFRHLFDIPNASFFQCGAIRLYLAVPETPELEHASSILYYRVADIQAEHRRLGAAGVEVAHEPRLLAPMETYDLWMSFYRDSEANLFALMAEVAR